MRPEDQGRQSKQRNNPMPRKPKNWPTHQATQYRAHSKRTGKPCRQPAVTGLALAPAGGAPKGNRNAWKHGRCSENVLAERRRCES
jgi:hypothetical protein